MTARKTKRKELLTKFLVHLESLSLRGIKKYYLQLFRRVF